MKNRYNDYALVVFYEKYLIGKPPGEGTSNRVMDVGILLGIAYDSMEDGIYTE